MPYFRDNTWDSNIWNDIVNNNEYSINDPWPFNLIDIGGHIGSFTFKMLSKHNTKKAIVIEPNIDNYRLLIKNLEEYISAESVIALNLGIGPTDKKININHSLGINTGGAYYSVSEDGVDTISLDGLIELIDNDSPILLKIDCEGCEYEALGSCKQLEKINCIVGEFHVTNTHSIDNIKNYLVNYHLSFHYRSDNLGLFGAHKK